MPKEAKKQVIKDELYNKLVEVGIIPEHSVEDEDNAEIEANAPPESKLADNQAGRPHSSG